MAYSTICRVTTPQQIRALDFITSLLDQVINRYRHRTDRLAVLIILNIENFRRITDTHGINKGDNILRELSLHLTRSVRDGDTVARIDVDDFGILLIDVASIRDVSTVSRKLFVGLPQVITVADEDIVPQYRAGIAVYPRDGADVKELVQHARLALAGARSYGEAYKFYSKALEDQSLRESAIERALQGAIKNEELRVFYQPIVAVKDRKTVGVEALLRWHNPELGPVSPADFITIAEETGQIIPIGFWVIKQVTHQLARWVGNGIDSTYIAINIFSKQLQQKGVAQRILAILNDVGGEKMSQRIALEITESVLIGNSEHVIPELNLLKATGITLYVDDFGTGYSSLSYLRRFPVDVLKIDREFITGLPNDIEAVALVKGIIGMARGIGLRVVAEGVETEEQFSVPRDLDCDMAQGYLFSKPVVPDEVLLRY